MTIAATGWAWAEIDLDAVDHNVGVLRRTVRPGRACGRVVKADGYGHGAVAVARRAASPRAPRACAWRSTAGGCRAAGRPASTAPILVLSEQPADDASAIDRHRPRRRRCTRPTTSTRSSRAAAPRRRRPVHVKVDTGHAARRCRARRGRRALVERVDASRHLRLAGVFTHLAVRRRAGATRHGRSVAAVRRHVRRGSRRALDGVARRTPPTRPAALAHRGGPPLVRARRHRDVRHLARPRRRRISPPSLRPVMSAASPGLVRQAGRRRHGSCRTGCGTPLDAPTDRGHRADRATPTACRAGWHAVVDTATTCSIAGRRRPIVGVVTMDQLMVDCRRRPMCTSATRSC